MHRQCRAQAGSCRVYSNQPAADRWPGRVPIRGRHLHGIHEREREQNDRLMRRPELRPRRNAHLQWCRTRGMMLRKDTALKLRLWEHCRKTRETAHKRLHHWRGANSRRGTRSQHLLACSGIAWDEFWVGFSRPSTGASGVRDFVSLAAFFGLMTFLILLSWSVRDGLWGRIEQVLLGALAEGQSPVRLSYHIDNTNKINANVLWEFAEKFPSLGIVP